MNIEQARIVATNEVQSGILKIESITFGGDSTTFRIVSETGNYILRSGGKRSNYDVEHAVLKLLIKKGVKVPVPVSDHIDISNPDLSFSLQREIRGVDLFRSKLPVTFWPTVVEELGRNLKSVHSLAFSGFGPISTDVFRSTKKLIGSFDTYSEFINNYFSFRVKGFKERLIADEKNGFKDSNLNKEQIRKVIEIVDRIPEGQSRIDEGFVDYLSEGRLLHGDFHSQHILVNRKKFVGIIDFNNVSIGDPLFDIAYWSIMPKDGFTKELLDNSGIKMDEDKFRLYRLIISIGKLHTRYVTHNYLNEYPEIIDFALEELNR